MRKLKMKAIKRCPGAKPGEEFTATSSEAKALVALGLAKRLESPAYSQTTAPEPASIEVDAAREDDDGAEVLISIAVRELAESAGLEVAELKGTGKDGRITKTDVEAAIAAKVQE